MNPSKELDEKVANDFLGWPPEPMKPNLNEISPRMYGGWKKPDGARVDPLPKFSTDFNSEHILIERLIHRKIGYRVLMKWQSETSYNVKFTIYDREGNPLSEATESSGPLALCCAVLGLRP